MSQQRAFVCCIFVILIIGGSFWYIQYIDKYLSPIVLWKFPDHIMTNPSPTFTSRWACTTVIRNPAGMCMVGPGRENRNGWEYRDNTTCTVVVARSGKWSILLAGGLVGWYGHGFRGKLKTRTGIEAVLGYKICKTNTCSIVVGQYSGRDRRRRRAQV